ncbi:MAG TPA: hypothetical protein DCP90_03085 [Clostridiales bacterium]|nr:MAG: hypothetical protein A2Y22_07440 [Clostridiales bacterium GWD2_32_59]HAN09579.1 hypothetical protein [Clostridiales bacterium]
MKLFTYLIVAEDIINNEKFFKKNNISATKEILCKEKAYEGQRRLPKKRTSRITTYTYVNNPKVSFVRFEYPNIDVYSASEEIMEKYKHAYVIMDTMYVDKLLDQVLGTNINKNNKKDKNDKKDAVVEITIKWADFKGIEKYPQLKDVEEKFNMHLRTSGHIGNPNFILHEKIYGNKKIDRRTQVIHHNGHSFDNRQGYLSLVDISRHRAIHGYKHPRNKNAAKGWEEVHGYYRPKKIDVDNCYSGALVCDRSCNKNIENCSNCGAVLYIDNPNKLLMFINSILNGTKYYELGKPNTYKDIIEPGHIEKKRIEKRKEKRREMKEKERAKMKNQD